MKSPVLALSVAYPVKAAVVAVTLALSGLSAVAEAPAAKAEPEYVAKVVMTLNGERVFTASGLGHDEAGAYSSSFLNPREYRKTASADGAGNVTASTTGRVELGASVKLVPRQGDGALLIDVDAKFSELVEMNRFETGGLVVELPNVKKYGIEGTFSAVRDGDGYVVNLNSGDKDGYALRVDLTPKAL